MSLNTVRIASALLIASLAFLPAAALTTPVLASDDDVICFDYPLPGGGEETECGTVGDYKAECKLTDPGNTTEFCQDVNSRLIAIWRAQMMIGFPSSDTAEIDIPSASKRR